MDTASTRPQMPLPRLFAFFLVPALTTAVMAQEPPATASLYVQGGSASGDTRTVTLGATLPWSQWLVPLGGGTLTGHWDAYLSRWAYDGPDRSDLLLLGLTPTLRWTPDGGRSAWFFEGGIGATLTSRLYRTQRKEFSTAFNFASHIGVGLRWGARREQEVVLRVQHVSNAGIKEPNPGQNFVQLRYAVHL